MFTNVPMGRFQGNTVTLYYTHAWEEFKEEMNFKQIYMIFVSACEVGSESKLL